MSTDTNNNNNELSLPYILAKEFANQTNRCLFITGKAGTGKTTFLKQLRNTTPKNIAVVAPTGVAAINAEGMTIHSFFQLPIRTLIPTPQSYRQLIAEQRINQFKRNMLFHLELLVIDEISMVRADVLDAIDVVLRHYRYRRDIPFGGVQVIMIGDLMQLSPVVHGEEGMLLSKYYNGPYFFQSKVMQELQPHYIELDHIFRQQNQQFVGILNEIRDNRLTHESKAMLASRYQPRFENKDQEFYITLTTHNQQADELNQQKLQELPGKAHTFKAEVVRNFPESNYPTDENLILKEGARVMFIKNDDQIGKRFYNGKLGIVIQIKTDKIVVRCDDRIIEVEPMQWENIRYKEDEQTGKIEEEVLGVFRQFPLRLAWAITIHKSQGLTFDRVIIDAARAFAAGQIYVALSRCRTLDGIVLSSPIDNVSLSNDQSVLNYINQQPSIEQAKGQLHAAIQEYRAFLFISLYSFARPLTLIEQLQKEVVQCVSFNQLTLPFLEELRIEIISLIEVADKFQKQLKSIIYSIGAATPTQEGSTEQIGEKEEYLKQRLNAAAGYFVPKITSIANKISTHPCRCKNKEDASDFDIMLYDLILVLRQKISLMKAVAQEATINNFLATKSRFVMSETEAADSAFAKKKPKEANLKAQSTAKKKKEKENLKPKISTTELTYNLFLEGYTPEQIAEKRELTVSTILNHLARIAAQGGIEVTDFVPKEDIDAILAVRANNPDLITLAEFHEKLNGEVPYGYIRAVLECYHLL